MAQLPGQCPPSVTAARRADSLDRLGVEIRTSLLGAPSPTWWPRAVSGVARRSLSGKRRWSPGCFRSPTQLATSSRLTWMPRDRPLDLIGLDLGHLIQGLTSLMHLLG